MRTYPRERSLSSKLFVGVASVPNPRSDIKPIFMLPFIQDQLANKHGKRGVLFSQNQSSKIYYLRQIGDIVRNLAPNINPLNSSDSGGREECHIETPIEMIVTLRS